MKTKIMKMFNQVIRCVSGANLNLFRYTAMVIMLLMLGVGNAWAGDHYYANVTASASPTGAGSVYVSFNTNKKGANDNATSDDQQNTMKNFYLWAETGYGYSWGNWSYKSMDSGGSYTFSDDAKKTKQGALFQAKTANSDGTLNYTVTANFNRLSIEAAGVSGSDMATQTWKSHAGTTVYLEDKYALQNSDVALTYSPASVGGLTKNASWTIGTTNDELDGAALTNGKWTVVLSYDFANPTTLVHNLSQTQTISEAGAVQSKTVKVPLDLTPVFSIPDGYAFPETEVGSTDSYSFSPSDYGDLPMGNAKLTWTATLTGANPDQFSINSATPTNGEVTVTFAPTVSQSSDAAVVLTATWRDASGADLSYSQTYNLHGDTPVDYEARVISSTKDVLFEGTFIEAVPVANANANCTLQLVNDVEVTSSIEFTNSLTLDLYGKELKRTGMTATSQLILLNTADKKLIITDSKPGALGSLYAAGNANAQLQAVKVADGSVEMSNCNAYIENTNTNGTEGTKYAIGVYVNTGKTFSMTGGTITVNRTGGRNGYGVYAEKTSTTTLTNITINTEAPSYAYGIVTDGTITITNVTATATAPTCSYGIYPTANASALVNSGSFTAHSTNGNTACALISKGNVVVMDGTFTASTSGNTSTAVYVTSGIIAIKKGTFSATATGTTSYGMHLNGGSSRAVVYGGTFSGLANGASSTTAAGVRVENTSVLEATAGTFTGTVDANGYTAATNVNSYGLLLASGGTANVSGATLKAENKQTYSRYAYGVSSAGALSLSNCNITAQSVYQYNMGISITGNTANIRDCNVIAKSTGAAYNYGIYVNAAAAVANVENTDFTVTSHTTYAYGANINNGTLNATNSRFDVTANQTTATSAGDANCHAIHVNTGKTANLRGCTIIAKTPKKDYSRYAYGVYNIGKVEIDECTISATSYYQYAYAIYAHTSSTYTHINSGKFKTSISTSAQVATQAPIVRTETKGKTVVYGGFFDKNTNLDYYTEDGYGINPLGSDRPEYAEGYRYVVEATSEQGNYVCKIGSTRYRTLEEALQYANQHTNETLTILMTANYSLPAGEYVLPPKATLLVPYSASQTTAKKENLERIASTGSRTPYLVLTFEDGVNFSAKGSIEVGGRQYSGGGSNTGSIADNYGQIVLNGDARIDMENSSMLYAWGYITGTGMVNVKDGSTVYEMFVMGDWHGGAQAYAQYNDKKAFLVSHYFYQNIEANVLYRPGAAAYGAGTVYASSSIQDVDPVEMIGPEGSQALFTMKSAAESADTYVKKVYHKNTDRLEFLMNSGASLNALTITAMGYEFPASKYILPICSNITITLAEGDIKVNQNFYFMPGSVLNINKEATLVIPSGKALYFYDGDENDFSHIWTSSYGTSSASNTSTIYRIGYTPSFVTNPRSASAWPDAELFVHGKVEVSGNLYTTTHGANIHSTNADAGKITFYSAVPASTTATINQHIGGKGSGFSGTAYYTAHALTPAQLKNDKAYEGTDDEYSQTASTSAKETWVYIEGKWTKLSEEGCFNTRAAGSNKQYYIHAGDAVEVDYPARADHAYKATNAERYFINAEDCMWWEAESQNIGGTDYYVANQEKYDNYGTCYYYDATTGYWKPKNVTVTWNIHTLSGAKTITYTDVPLNTRPKYNSETPAKQGDGTADYVWKGWENTSGNIYGRNEELPIATGDVTYTAVFEERKYQYTVAFLNPDGSPISGKKYEVGQIPVAPEAPVMSPTVSEEYEFTGWDKAIVAVTGPTEYTAVYATHPRKYDVTFFDLDGKTVLQSSQVEYNTLPAYKGSIPTHSDKYYTYSFDGWSPEIVKVTGIANYTARYNTTKNKYTITFKNTDGSIVDQQLLDAGDMPVVPANPTMEALDVVYTFSSWDKPIVEVTEDAVYTASYTSAPRSYTIRFVNWNNVEIQKGSVAYGTKPTVPATTPTKPSDAEYDYEFAGWTPEVVNVSGDAVYRATFNGTKKKYTILFQNPKGTTLTNPAALDNQWEHGSLPTYTGVTPTKASDVGYSYEFNEWTPSVSEVTGNKTYIADFTATERKFTVTWDANGGWCGTASTNVKGGEEIGALPTATKEAYIFAGWFTSTTGGTEISATQIITGDVTYHAHWTPAVASVSVEGETPTYHTTIADAFTAAATKTNPTIKMLQDVALGTSSVTYDGDNTCTLDLNGHTISGTSNRLLIIDNASANFTITDNSEGKSGQLSMSTSASGAAFCAYAKNGTLYLEAGTVYLYSTSTGSNAVAVRADGGGTFIMTGGTAHVKMTKSGRVGYSTQSLGAMTINGGELLAESANGEAYAMYVTGTMTVNGGKYHVTGATPSIIHSTSTPDKLLIKGGYYNINSGMVDFVAPDKADWNYYLFSTTAAEKAEVGSDYNYKVAEGYTVTFNANGHGTAPAQQLIIKGQKATEPIAPEVEGYTFGGWYKEAGCSNAWIFASDVVTAAKTLYAKWTIKQYTLTVEANNDAMGTVTGGGLYNYNSVRTITATPNAGFKFVKWNDDNTENPRSVTIPATDVEYTAIFDYDIANYTVKHWQQNLVDNEYTEVTGDAQVKSGTVGATTAAEAKSYTGFTAKPITQGTIAVGGSTIVNVYYNRNTYTVTWKNGDTAIETDNGVKYGAAPSFDSEETPTKATDATNGYTFDGWSATNGGDVIAEFPSVSANTTYYAHYSTDPTVASVKVGSADPTYYTDFAEAWEATNSATGEVTLKLLQDVSGIATSLAYTNAQNCTFDLNNHTLSGTVTKLIDVNTSGKTFTIDDSSDDKGGMISMVGSGNSRFTAVYITAGKVNLKQGKVYSKNTGTYNSSSAKNVAAAGVETANGGNFTMDDGTIESESQYKSYALFINKGTSSVVEINGGLIKGHTNKGTTACGIYNSSTKLTINNGHIVGHAWTKTSYGLYNYYGKATINGGIIEATNDTINGKGTTTAYGICTAYSSSTYTGAITIPSTSTVKVYARTNTTTAYAVVIGGASTGSTIAGGTFTAKAGTTTAQGINSAGTITVSGGTFNVYAATTSSTVTTWPCGIYATRGTVTVNGNPTFNVTSGTSRAFGAFAYGTIGAKGTGKYSGTIKINGGTFNVKTEGTTTAYGAYAGLLGKNIIQKSENAGDTIFGQHYMPGIIEITDGTFNVAPKTTTSYGIGVAAANTESGAVGTTTRIPKVTVKGGKFNVTGTSKTYAVSTGATNTALVVEGGWYNINTNLSGYVAPTKDCNYHVLPLPEEELPYKYKVAEAYTVTFNNYDGTELQSGLLEKGQKPAYTGQTPTKTATAQYTYTFNNTWSPALAPVEEGAQTYTAQFSETPQVYKVTLHTNEGTINADHVESYTYGEGATLPTNIERVGFDFAGWFDNSGLDGSAVTSISTTATGDKEYWAKWETSTYTITWLNWDGDALDDPTITSNIEYGGTPAYSTVSNPTPTRNPYNGKTYAWDGWTTEVNGAGTFYAIGEFLPEVTANATYYAHFRITAIEVNTSDNIEIEENTNVETTIVHVQGALMVSPSATLSTDDLILEGTPNSSGEITGTGTVTATHAYFDFSNGAEGFKARTWYAVAVPWEVNADAGVIINGNVKTLGSDFDLIYYDGARRATQGANKTWNYVEDDVDHTMKPGTAYMIYLAADASTIRFERTSGELLKTTLEVHTYEGPAKDANWNGIANPALYHAYINAHANTLNTENAGQIYNAESKSYFVVDLRTYKLVVGQPVFIQATSENDAVTAYANQGEAFLAPRRSRAQNMIDRYEVSLVSGSQSDKIVVRADSEKESDTYTLGQDLLKMSVSSLVPQMWIEGYNSRLCINTAIPTNNAAIYPLGIYAPQAGEYTITIGEQQSDESMLYLTYNGRAIWNLSYGDYTGSFEKGTNSHYGLRIVSTRADMPTGIEETTIENGEAVRKVIIEDKVYIIRNGEIYSVTGQKME